MDKIDDVKNFIEFSPFEIDQTKFSSLNKLLRVTAFARRFIENLKRKDKMLQPLSPAEIFRAKKSWIKYAQADIANEIKKNEKSEKGDLSYQLGLKIGEDGLVRCHGRLINSSSLDSVALCPVYLPSKCYFSTLLIRDTHKRLLHSGIAHTLSEIRNEYWIPKGRKTVRDELLKCGSCRKFQGGPFQMPKMMTWPERKLSRSIPFTYTGLDYLGPIYVKSKSGRKKVWIALFTFVVVRAIHLEVISDMTAEKFLMALRRFLSRRGKPDEIILDNASQFVAAKTVVNLAMKNVINDSDIYNYTASNGIKWNFITEFAPWEGGFYERLVGMVKNCIRKTVGRLLLTKDQLITFSTEIEAVINSRPLMYVHEDIESNNLITPAHFINVLLTTGTPTLIEDKSYGINRHSTAKILLEIWKKGQNHLNSAWKMWRDEYLLSLS